jgi:WD40 repeat protein
LVAALSNDWRVGIWDRVARRLLHVLEVTPGFHTDNVALAFSPEGRRIAFSSGREASLWDLATGEPLRTWKLFPGLVDQMAFPEANRLLLYRVETESGELGPFGMVSPRQHPRVCRIRDLLGPEPKKPLAEIRDCNWAVYHGCCSPDGKYYALEGRAGSPGKFTRVANLYEGLTGKKLGALPSQRPIKADGAFFFFDPTGTVLQYLYKTEKENETYFLRIPSLAVSRQLDTDPVSLGPQGKRWLVRSSGSAEHAHEPGTLTLFEEGRPAPLVRFVLDVGNDFMVVGKPRFSSDGQHIIWGSPTGVTLVDLVEVNHRLSELGLGW